ncbi:MAG: hypothetical protein QNK92_12040 [Amylibacter sp.]
MKSNPLNNPFVSYVVTQSLLVLIILSASFLSVELLKTSFGIDINRLWISLGLVLFAQLPVAVMYAHTETRHLSRAEGWGLSIVFVAITVAFEMVLQNIAGHSSLPFMTDLSGEAAKHQAIAVLGFLIGVPLAFASVKKLFAISVEIDLSLDETPAVRNNGTRPVSCGRRPSVKRDYSELYRREWIGAKIAIFGLSLMVADPKLMELLKLSIPLSIAFSLVCLANRMARSGRNEALSTRCLNVTMQMLPLTVVAMALLALSTMYANYVSVHGGDRDVVGYVTWLAFHMDFDLASVMNMLTYVGVLFAICLAGNTLFLTLFTRLIRPLVAKQFTKEPAKKRMSADEVRGLVNPNTKPQILAARELHARLNSKLERTPRPFLRVAI